MVQINTLRVTQAKFVCPDLA